MNLPSLTFQAARWALVSTFYFTGTLRITLTCLQELSATKFTELALPMLKLTQKYSRMPSVTNLLKPQPPGQSREMPPFPFIEHFVDVYFQSWTLLLQFYMTFLDAYSRFLPALPTDQIQSNKLPNKSIKYAKILFQIKRIQNPGFEITFDIFGT
jgi:hypothetical protein